MSDINQAISQGTLYIITAPSGAGKTSLVNALVKALPDICISISCTTRPKRPGEEEGQHYHFVDHATFEKMIESQAFFEHAQVFGHYYGTPRAWVIEQLNRGKDVVLEIDWQGAQQILKQQEAVSIFIFPPSRAILRQRLHNRCQDSPEVIERRLAEASIEMSHYAEFDYLLINDIFDDACADLKAIVCAQRLSLKRQAVRHRQLVAELLKND